MKKSAVFIIFSALVVVSTLSFGATLIAADNSSHSTFSGNQDNALSKKAHKPTNQSETNKTATRLKTRINAV